MLVEEKRHINPGPDPPARWRAGLAYNLNMVIRAYKYLIDLKFDLNMPGFPTLSRDRDGRTDFRHFRSLLTLIYYVDKGTWYSY